jgi:hypothetical protein
MIAVAFNFSADLVIYPIFSFNMGDEAGIYGFGLCFSHCFTPDEISIGGI